MLWMMNVRDADGRIIGSCRRQLGRRITAIDAGKSISYEICDWEFEDATIDRCVCLRRTQDPELLPGWRPREIDISSAFRLD